MRQSLRPCFTIVIFVSLLCAMPMFAQSAGQNINMVSGTDWTTGDPFLQRQNEPSIAVSTRNPAHVVAASNDYRAVDIPGLLGIEERGDAWLGVFKSFDAGQTWGSSLLPGYPFDSSPEGLASPLRGFQAAADPTVRPGTNGLFYVSGIVFNRGTNAPSAVFVTRYVDNNNRENGDPTAKNGGITNIAPTDSIRYLGSKIVASGSSTTFVDKPWLAVDVPRGTATCTIPFKNADGTTGTETIPAGNVYLTYTTLKGSTSTINFIRSTDCGVTWSTPKVLSQAGTLNQGTVIAVSPNPRSSSSSSSSLTSSSTYTSSTGTVYVAWRRFASATCPDAIMIARSTDGGSTFSVEDAIDFPKACATTPTGPGCVFDQGLSTPNPYGGSFRTNAYPALTVDDTGRVYLAWSQRQTNGDARIMMTVSSTGDYWTAPRVPIDNTAVEDDFGNPFLNLSNRGHQVMPTLNFNTGKLMLAYYDLRQDHTLGMFTPNADASNFTETRQLIAELTDPTLFTAVFNPYITDTPLAGFPSLTTRRHTLDLEGAQASPPTAGLLTIPTFNTFRISRYLFGINPFDTTNQAEQLQVNVPNLPIFVEGTQPFMGDYIDLAGAPPFVLKNGKWQFNTATVTSPIFHTAWTDNRDVRPPLDGNWQNYAPPFSASNPSTPHPSVFDPNQTVGACTSDNNAGMRNQNIYSSRIANGLVVTSPGNSKFLGVLPSNTALLFQRAYAINVQNSSDATRQFQFTILNQPPDAPTGQASMLQFSFSTTLGPITVAPHASMSRPVFVKSSVTTASISVQVAEVDPANPSQLLAGGLQSTITINPDPTAPTIIDPANPAIGNPAIGNFELYNPAIGNPAIGNPAIGNPAIGNPAIGNPAIGNPAIGNPAIVAALNPAIGNPAIGNPAIGNPAIGNPAIGNPAIGNPAIGNQPMTDASFTVENVGNTSSSYAVKLFGNQPPNTNLQLIVTKTYATPIQDNCQLGQETTTFLVTNVLNPTFAQTGDVGDPLLQNGTISNSTLSLAPNETAQVTIRAFHGDPTPVSVDEMKNVVLVNVTPVIVAHPVNTADAVNGVVTPPQTLLITSPTVLPNAFVGQSYSTLIATLGGTANKTFTVISDPSLPSPLTLDPITGAITGIPATGGTFTFTIQVSDGNSTVLRTFTLNVIAPLSVGTTTLPDGVVGKPYSATLTSTGGTAPVTWSVTSSPNPLTALGLSLSASGAITGTPTTATSGATFTVTATDSSTSPQTASQSLTLRIGGLLTITTTTLPAITPGVPYSQQLTATGGLGTLTWSLSTGALPPGITLSAAGLLSGTFNPPAGSSPTSPSSFAFTVTVSDASSPTPQTASQSLTLTLAAQYKLSFYVQPKPNNPLAQITPAVKVLVVDANGNPVKNVVVNITLSINPTGATLTGTTATTGANGIAIFAYQVVNKPGNGYQMEATAPALPGAVPAFSNLFNVK